MADISVHLRLRPLRLAFLVRPDDKKRTLDIFRVNTCLWGGKYNPIIPYLRQVPRWWDLHHRHFETAAQIINGYFDFFEPDFIVEAESGLADSLGFDNRRILQLSNFIQRATDRDRNGCGLSVFDLYSDLYRTEFQFSRRHEHDIVDIAPAESTFAAFSACLFGAFPIESDLKYLGEAFRKFFEPQKVSLDADSLAKLYKSGFTSALRLTDSKLKVNYHDYNDPARFLFVLDAHQPRDLIDFWNLRALRRFVVAIPVQWLGQLSDFTSDFVVENYPPFPGPNQIGVRRYVTVIFGRSIATQDIERLHTDHFSVEGVGRGQYPPIWRRSVVRQMRPSLSAAEKKFEVPFVADKPEIRFDPLYPEFADQSGNHNRWSNVVRLEDWSFKNQIATAFLCDYKNASSLDWIPRVDRILSTTEGFIMFSGYKNAPFEEWEIPDGTTAITDWLKAHGIKARMSDAGRATQEIIQTLGGFSGVAGFAHAGIVKLLNETSRKPVTRSVHYREFKNKIQNAIKNEAGGRNFESLVERGAVELGLELKCTNCSSWSWYSLRQLDYQMTCSLCLRQFGFPIVEPGSGNSSKWAYRLIGPFALPDYAKGGYASSLSIRFFHSIIGRGRLALVTWSGGQEIELAANDKLEVDFILWYQRKELLGNDYPTEIVFGEAKSFGKNAFQPEDVDGMKKLADRFPGAVLVFSTMKQGDELSSGEVRRITKLAEWGREYMRDRAQTRAPVIVLTGTELFVPGAFTLARCWEKLGGRHAQLIEPGWSRPLANLRVLADLTQQLYLNMPSYGAWREAKAKARSTRRKVRPSPFTP